MLTAVRAFAHCQAITAAVRCVKARTWHEKVDEAAPRFASTLPVSGLTGHTASVLVLAMVYW